MEKKMQNDQYIKFILEHIVRPYQNMIDRGGMIGSGKRIENLRFTATKSEKSINYFDLHDMLSTNQEWKKLVIDRLSRIYSEFDFSFFPDEKTAYIIKYEMMGAGIKSVSPFENS